VDNSLQNFKLLIEYDGTAYSGWQRQASGRTIQGTIESALNTMTENSVTLIGSGRTDAGVHAVAQVANFRAETRLTSDVFLRGLNSLLPVDVVINDCSQVDKDFHARFDAKSKVYEYRILNHPIRAALFRQYAWHISTLLDVGAMRTAIDHLKGEQDFAAFQAAGGNQAHAVRTVMKLRLSDKDAKDYVVFSIEADGFVRHMVRNIVGTLVDVGLGKTSPAGFKDILLSKDRTRAGITAPAHGLFLMEVKY
jgi:tRNA pseudouridine38-40 synthase